MPAAVGTEQIPPTSGGRLSPPIVAGEAGRRPVLATQEARSQRASDDGGHRVLFADIDEPGGLLEHVADELERGAATPLRPANRLGGDIGAPPGGTDQALRPELLEGLRSEERRVGKECRTPWSPHHS